MVEQDYVMRIIHEIVRTFLKLVFNIDEEKQEEVSFENDEIAGSFESLCAMADRGKINEAENILYEELEEGNLEYLKMAVLFYEHLNKMSNEYLEKCDYSRQEVADGMKQVIKMYGYDGLAETLVE